MLITTAGTGLFGIDTAGGYIVGQNIVVYGPGAVGLRGRQLGPRCASRSAARA